MSIAWSVYRAVAPVLGMLAPVARPFATPTERERWSERLGDVGPLEPVDAWIHAASLGETLGVPPLMRALRDLDSPAKFFLTAMTETGRQRLTQAEGRASLAPIDAPQAVRRFFARVDPGLMILVETELWPHWLIEARRRRVPVVVASARLSERSRVRYARLGREFRALIAELAAVLCQTDADADRWRALGVPSERIEVAGNLKDDALPQPAPNREEARRALGLAAERPLLVLGSLRPGEARVLAKAWVRLPRSLRSQWQVVAIARHRGAAAEIRREAAERGVATVALAGVEVPVALTADAWGWDDRPGVLASYYAAAEVAFVGGSLAPFGGHNPMEPAATGAAVVMGPHHVTQRDAVQSLLAKRALVVEANDRGLAEIFESWLSNQAEREQAGSAALQVAAARRGAARRTAARLAAIGLWPARTPATSREGRG